jgi:hypothetical protein
MVANTSKEDKLLLFGYGAIAVAYTILFVIKFKHIRSK